MNFENKIVFFSEYIEKNLLPIVGEKCVLWDLPYHGNIGDILIWEGELNFLNKHGIELLHSSSISTFDFPMVSSDVTILLHGGGNFGDIWREHQLFRLKIVEKYPNNKIIILPQTVYYFDETILEEDAKILGSHANLTICVRDNFSLSIMRNSFKQNVSILLPDMAFCIPRTKLTNLSESKKGILYVDRIDRESNASALTKIPNTAKFRDWPSVENARKYFCVYDKLLYLNSKFNNRCNKLIDWYMTSYVKNKLIRLGILFLSEYEYIYTSRLHACILSILLHKDCTIVDNSYGKNSAFYETWLQDLDGVKLN